MTGNYLGAVLFIVLQVLLPLAIGFVIGRTG